MFVRRNTKVILNTDVEQGTLMATGDIVQGELQGHVQGSLQGVVQDHYTKLYSFKLSWRIVSFTAANTNRIFSVSEIE